MKLISRFYLFCREGRKRRFDLIASVKWEEKFGWQDEYFAVSVNGAEFSRVYEYITNQESHIRKRHLNRSMIRSLRYMVSSDKGLKPWRFYAWLSFRHKCRCNYMR